MAFRHLVLNVNRTDQAINFIVGQSICPVVINVAQDTSIIVGYNSVPMLFIGCLREDVWL